MNLQQRCRQFVRLQWQRLIVLNPLATVVAGVLVAGVLGSVQPLYAALQVGGSEPNVLIGADDDNTANPAIQPPNTAANQSLNNTDVQVGGFGNDVLIGLLGNDVQRGGPGHDILVGGTEQGTQPNSDVQFGDFGNDVSIWAPGDGSDAFVGGRGLDAQIFGVIDRDASNVPILSPPFEGFPQGVPTADVTNSPGFCTLERVQDPAFGFAWLVRFFVRSTGALAVTIRLAEVEQVFCTSQAGGQITYADLTQAEPQFTPVTLEQVRQLNATVALIIR